MRTKKLVSVSFLYTHIFLSLSEALKLIPILFSVLMK